MTDRRVLVPEIAGGIEIRGDAAHHLSRVLRVRPGDELIVFDGSGREADAVVEEVSAHRVLVRADRPRQAATEPDMVVHCHPALVKHADRYAEMVRALVELGAGTITPLLTDRSVAGPPGDGRLNRWRRVAAEAARQSGRAVIPAVRPVVRLADLSLPAGALGVVADPGAPPPRIAEGVREVVLVTGPEGGLTAAEVAGLCGRGFRRAGLGPRVLRADTAAIALLAVLTAARGR